ncbi:MAG: hypothetical protein R3D97_03575 [Paracoccaceae bacterium]
MDLNRLINMVINTVTRRLVNLGINKGIEMAARRGKTDGPMTAEERAQVKAGRDMAKRARQASKITRRLGR